MINTTLLQRLSPEPILGVSMNRVSVLRLDMIGGDAPGNKAFKLKYNLAAARAQGLERVLSFGGPWSNHLHALAAQAAHEGVEAIGIVRGECPAKPSAMLLDAADWGMHLEFVSRADYRRRSDSRYLSHLSARFGPCLFVPEGGANVEGLNGCRDIAKLLPAVNHEQGAVVLPVGTGTTLAGIACGLTGNARLVGISVLKGAVGLEQAVRDAIAESAFADPGNWEILHDFHCGGYARVSPELRTFILEFQRIQKIPLDPVYTGKAFYAAWQLIGSGAWQEPLCLIHTGGLQGRRGFPWLAEQPD